MDKPIDNMLMVLGPGVGGLANSIHEANENNDILEQSLLTGSSTT